MNIKNILFAIGMGILTAAFTGCTLTEKTVSSDTVAKTSRTIGVSAGAVVKLSNIDACVHERVVEIMTLVSEKVPTNTTDIASTWAPIAETEIAKSVADGKLTTDQATAAKSIMNIAGEGVNYLFTRLFAKYPTLKDSVDLTNVAIKSFTEGFISVVAPTTSATSVASEMDEDAYNYLKTKFNL